MSDVGLDQRLAAAGRRLDGLGPALDAGRPWPLSARFDHAPEASWGPPEILAHLAEMLPYWLGEAERILDAGAAPQPFGRSATDQVRLAIIERDRTIPLRELQARVQAGIERWRRRLAALDERERTRLGVHPTLGELSVANVAERFVVGHLEGHLDQLTDAISGGPPTV